MKTIRLLPTVPLYDIYVRFHAGEITHPVARQSAKVLLYGIHYGSLYDTSDADIEVARRRSTNGK